MAKGNGMIKNIVFSFGLLFAMTNTAMLYDEEEKAATAYEMQPTKLLTPQTIQNKTTPSPQLKPRERCCMSFLKILENHFSTPNRKAPWYLQG